MKKLFNPLLCLLLAATVVSCSKNDAIIEEQTDEGPRPLADYEIVKSPDGDPFTFEFKNKSTNYKTIEWRFGDDSLATDLSLEHVYKSTGKFEVNMNAISDKGAIARKLIVIDINPDSVLKLNAVKTGNANEVKYSMESKATIGSVLWNFDAETSSTSMTPVVTYGDGTLNEFTVKMTTAKGSVVELTKFGTTEGIVSNVTNLVKTQVSKDNSGGASSNEGSLKIIDNNVETKLYLPGWGGSWSMQFMFPSATKIKYYGIGSGNDSPDRDPKTWTFEGSNDGVNWTVLDTRSLEQNFFDQKGGQYKQMFYYSVATPGSYVYYKYNVSTNFGSGDFQISDFRLYK
jgi:hypothetical protein